MKRALLVLTLAGACGGGRDPFAPGADAAPAPKPDAAPPLSSPTGEVEAEPQRAGDAEAGYRALVNNGYVSCGIPWALYSQFFATGDSGIPGRDGRNATLPYNFTAFTTATGVEVVTANCLTCHAGRLNGELVLGLGATDVDYTSDAGGLAELSGRFLTKNTPEWKEWRKWADRVVAIAGYTITKTVGVNPADNLAAVLFAHRDVSTLAWSNDAILELPPAIVVPVDVPPWWRMSKKNAMFYDGAGRGDQARIMMSASALCTDSEDEAAAIDAYFPDVRAWILSLEPPAWPWDVDAELAGRGKTVFESTCSRCHGTYGEGGEYPNLIIALDEVGTDPILAIGGAQFAGRFVDWFNSSFYGETARLAPAAGYYAPPLDGIWATAPFLHNGSVPTLAALLDSTTRPAFWERTFDSTDYDQAGVGWNYVELDHGQDGEPDFNKAKLIYDTRNLGYSNGGHTYGDELTADERTALLEYLKTL